MAFNLNFNSEQDGVRKQSQGKILRQLACKVVVGKGGGQKSLCRIIAEQRNERTQAKKHERNL